ncbi:hypothetical protein [Methyloglobulus sp.]|uniref:hypothetical protein n=1 Tax=Methyloglobulus sp. TaxID=2518622 RepID=UPI0032B803C7
MSYNRTAINLQANTPIQIGRRNAYHQAGHAAAIYLGNQQKQLPAVHFQIIITPQERDARQTARITRKPGKYTAKVEGGRLIQSLPLSFAEATRHVSPSEQEQYRCAFEADVINLLAESLAEAKYVALRDDEIFNANLVYLGVLQFYGGNSDLKMITEYMECFIPDRTERKQKLAELFLEAYSFINKQSNWSAITALAEFIRTESQSIIPCEDLISLLESLSIQATGHHSKNQANTIYR